MAGIGFELRKIFHEESSFAGVKGSLAASFATVGPMVMCIILSFMMQNILKSYGITYQDLQLYNSINIYSFFLSFVVTNGICLLGARKLSDNIYQRKLKRTFSEFLSINCLYVPIVGVIMVCLFWGTPLQLGYQFILFFMTVSLGIILIEITFLSAIKNYRYIVLSFLCTIIGILLISIGCMKFFNIAPLLTALCCSGVGYTLLMLTLMIKLYRVFGDQGIATFKFKNIINFIKMYWQLPLIGLFLGLGVYSHHLIMWLSSHANIIADTFRVCNFYDIPGFYAVLTIVPAAVLFTVKAETIIYPKYKIFYDYIRDGGNIKDIKAAKLELIETMKQEFYFMVQVQFIVTFIAIVLGLKFLSSMGLTTLSTSIFTILCLAYLCYITASQSMILLLYFDARKSCLKLATFFVLSTIACSIITLILGRSFYGYGFFISSFLTAILGFMTLNRYLKNIEVHTFASQPVYAKVMN
ncbi:exopolysaccharide Pel transporter PelG [Turicibacter sanguinis]|uniref:exopolysaccharide Pel transporter PelG n=1 Tax=Turicibacter sanguinis TaxID=154288 RepID=UPI00101ECB80|nr:exopolysaccharide Pel transporter PelG [Turicibacter sanguinis]MDB8438146.1 exopolysaccharide Pel transporter PelG [Turicibacter sanguinis]MDB8564095.1 exopolysaccharide Pel transporter PelG [Turicibacter sanguinis]MTK70039.1 hypothetical protein [Turicibacter sanguinis]MTK80876.1 hypothetical protein [Turicibacter sanguinis]MTK84022.1 hypothetical protein [Turicibacter sanguinis]